MKQARILTLLGPAAVLYLVADVASVGGGLSPMGIAVAAVAFLCALAPVAVRATEAAGAARTMVLGVLGGIALGPAVRPEAPALAIDVAHAVAAAAGAGLLLDLALSAPDAPARLPRPRLIRGLGFLGAVAAGLLGILAVLPPVEIGGEPLLLPARFERFPAAAALFAAIVALGLRLARRRLGSGPDALAANTWATMGLVPGVVGGGLALALAAAGVLGGSSTWVRAAIALAVLATVAGHVGLVDPRRRLVAGRAARRAVSVGLAIVLVSALVALLRDQIPREPWTLGALAGATLLLAAIAYRVVAPIVYRLIAPHGGRLLDGLEEASSGLGRIATLDELAAAVLPPLRTASGSGDAEPILYTFDPPREVTIDAARIAHVRDGAMPEALASYFLERPGEIVVRAPLEATVVRRPDLRPLVDALAALDALCAVPLSAHGELEGLVIVPRGRRRVGLGLEEMAALTAFSDRVGGLVALLSAQARAQKRAGDLALSRDRAEERADSLEEELGRVRGEANVLRLGRAAGRLLAPTISYSPAMRGLERRMKEVAPMDAPVLLLAGAGTPVDHFGRRLHVQSGRAAGPFVIADCASVRPEVTATALFGCDEESVLHPGWLRLARGGTLLLVDVPALSKETQTALAEALAVRQARPVGGAGAYEVDVRVIATSRVDVEPLVAGGVFDAELGRWLAPLRLEVPPLHGRREDIPSLVLLALDRACRVLGRPVIGIEPPALDALVMHDWPGNLRELHSVIDRAVARAPGTLVTLADLPRLVPGDALADDDPLDGTYEALEKRILRHAIKKAAGNKSEAARMLGLKRTTFLDKLRRFGIDPSGDSGEAEDAA